MVEAAIEDLHSEGQSCARGSLEVLDTSELHHCLYEGGVTEEWRDALCDSVLLELLVSRKAAKIRLFY